MKMISYVGSSENMADYLCGSEYMPDILKDRNNSTLYRALTTSHRLWTLLL